MTIEEAMRLIESNEFAEYDGKRLKKYADLRSINRNLVTKNKIRYKDDKRYNDHHGLKWLNVKDRSFETIAMAVIDGCCDAHRFGLTHDDYMEIVDKAAMETLLNAHSKLHDLVMSNELDYAGFAKGIWPFLRNFFEKHFIHVYRGINLTKKDINRYVKNDLHILTNIDNLIGYISNETKEFNSFSVNPIIVAGFAIQFGGQGQYHIIIEGDADKNDINWAFTAYLMGRHGGTMEHELNINNIKMLRNLHINKEMSNIPKINIYDILYAPTGAKYMVVYDNPRFNFVKKDTTYNTVFKDWFIHAAGPWTCESSDPYMISVTLYDGTNNYFDLRTGELLFSQSVSLKCSPFFRGRAILNPSDEIPNPYDTDRFKSIYAYIIDKDGNQLNKDDISYIDTSKMKMNTNYTIVAKKINDIFKYNIMDMDGIIMLPEWVGYNIISTNDPNVFKIDDKIVTIKNGKTEIIKCDKNVERYLNDRYCLVRNNGNTRLFDLKQKEYLFKNRDNINILKCRNNTAVIALDGKETSYDSKEQVLFNLKSDFPERDSIKISQWSFVPDTDILLVSNDTTEDMHMLKYVLFDTVNFQFYKTDFNEDIAAVDLIGIDNNHNFILEIRVNMPKFPGYICTINKDTHTINRLSKTLYINFTVDKLPLGYIQLYYPGCRHIFNYKTKKFISKHNMPINYFYDDNKINYDQIKKDIKDDIKLQESISNFMKTRLKYIR